MRYLTLRPDSFIENIESDFDSILSGNFLEKFLDRKTKELSIPVNLKEYDDSYEVMAELPGVKKEDIELDIDKNHIRITAKKEEEKEEKHKKFYKSEFRYGETSRTIYFPEDVNTENANAKMDKGILKIKLPKAENNKDKSQKLNIE